MKNTTASMLKRWRELDRVLAFGHVPLAQLAKRMRVNVKTLRRDIQAFRKLGQTVILVRHEDGSCEWCYARPVRPLFTSNYLDLLELERSRRERCKARQHNRPAGTGR